MDNFIECCPICKQPALEWKTCLGPECNNCGWWPTIIPWDRDDLLDNIENGYKDKTKRIMEREVKDFKINNRYWLDTIQDVSGVLSEIDGYYGIFTNIQGPSPYMPFNNLGHVRLRLDAGFYYETEQGVAPGNNLIDETLTIVDNILKSHEAIFYAIDETHFLCWDGSEVSQLLQSIREQIKKEVLNAKW